jgi:aspartate carbamoyltransferase catalytic subunit
VTLVRSILDLEPAQIDWILDRAWEHKRGTAEVPSRASSVVGLAFFETSLRTRVGFAAASARLGATPVEVHGVRSSAVSQPESVTDTFRVLSGYCDAVVARLGEPFPDVPVSQVPFLNAGDRGSAAEHPSQALIDLFALQASFGTLDELTIALCGDLRMRAARSLLLLLAARPPRKLLLITESALTFGFELPVRLAGIAECRSLDEVADADVLYIVGMPYGALPDAGRDRLRVTRGHLDALPAHAVVLSPLPLIDEIDRDALEQDKVRVFQQSDDGLYVRMALVEFLLDRGPRAPTSSP